MARLRSHLAGSAFVTFGFAVAMMGTTLPTPLYPLYNRAFGLAPVLTPVIFATYAGVLRPPRPLRARCSLHVEKAAGLNTERCAASR
jgi:hypothetical protein